MANSRWELIVSILYHGGKPQQRELNLDGHGVFLVIAFRWQFCLFVSYEGGRDAQTAVIVQISIYAVMFIIVVSPYIQESRGGSIN